MSGVQIEDLSLNGTKYLEEFYPDEYQAMEWLRQFGEGTLTEAVGGSYTNFARISTHTGIPTVLGWPGHESQWRGGAEEMGSREPDIETLYRTSDWNTARDIILKYDIRYIYVGSLERSTYRPNEAKFKNHLSEAFRNETVTIYQVSDYLVNQ